MGLATVPTAPRDQGPRVTPLRLGARTEVAVVTHGNTASLLMQSGRPIHAVVVRNETAVRINRCFSNPRFLGVRGAWPGAAWFTLQDIDGRQEELVVIVVSGLFPFAP
jgi:hypothetical protein